MKGSNAPPPPVTSSNAPVRGADGTNQISQLPQYDGWEAGDLVGWTGRGGPRLVCGGLESGGHSRVCYIGRYHWGVCLFSCVFVLNPLE